jgi:tetratricopeptide (TPR) repeat protein
VDTEVEIEQHLAAAKRSVQKRQFKSARQELDAAAGLMKPGDQRMALYHERIGFIAFMGGDRKAAKAAYMKAIQAARETGFGGRTVGDAHAGLGICLSREGNVRYAETFLRKAMEIGPSPAMKRLAQNELDSLEPDASGEDLFESR